MERFSRAPNNSELRRAKFKFLTYQRIGQFFMVAAMKRRQKFQSLREQQVNVAGQ